MKGGLLFFSFILAISLSSGLENGDHDWKYFVYSQWWPQSQCYYKLLDTTVDQLEFNDLGFRNSCVPADVESWTIHGLWPTLNGTPNPGFCNHSWPFNVNDIKELEPKMMKQWLSFPESTESSARKLWTHEWEKHGTCATSLSSLDSEFKYFSKALALNIQLNVLKTFQSVGITPTDDKTYQVKDVENAIRKAYGVKGRVVCLRGPDDDTFLGGIRVCLDKTFKMIDCLVTKPEECGRGVLKYPAIIRSSSTF